MREFTWKYTQYSQFNETDTLLLVSGVHFGAHSTSGEIAVFNLVGKCPDFWVLTAQGKQIKWPTEFPVRKNTVNLEFCQNTGNFDCLSYKFPDS